MNYIYLVIFANEKSAILQSSLKKSVLNLCKFMVYNTNFKTAVYFSFESPDFLTSDRHKMDDKYVFCITLMKFYEIFSFWLFRGFHGRNFLFFSRPHFRFHGWDLAENFTGTVDFSRAVSKTFSREGIFFSRAENQKFSREGFFFTGKKTLLCY